MKASALRRLPLFRASQYRLTDIRAHKQWANHSGAASLFRLVSPENSGYDCCRFIDPNGGKTATTDSWKFGEPHSGMTNP